MTSIDLTPLVAYEFGGFVPSPVIGAQNALEPIGWNSGILRHRSLNHSMNIAKTNALLQESPDRDLIGRIQHRRHRAAGFKRAIGQTQSGISFLFDGQKSQFSVARKIERAQVDLESLRTRKSVRNRYAHVRDAELRDNRTIPILNHRMHDALGVNDHLG